MKKAFLHTDIYSPRGTTTQYPNLYAEKASIK